MNVLAGAWPRCLPCCTPMSFVQDASGADQGSAAGATDANGAAPPATGKVPVDGEANLEVPAAGPPTTASAVVGGSGDGGSAQPPQAPVVVFATTAVASVGHPATASPPTPAVRPNGAATGTGAGAGSDALAGASVAPQATGVGAARSDEAVAAAKRAMASAAKRAAPASAHGGSTVTTGTLGGASSPGAPTSVTALNGAVSQVPGAHAQAGRGVKRARQPTAPTAGAAVVAAVPGVVLAPGVVTEPNSTTPDLDTAHPELAATVKLKRARVAGPATVAAAVAAPT